MSRAWPPHAWHWVTGLRMDNAWASLLQRLALSLLTPEELRDSPRRTQADILHSRDRDPLKEGAGGGGRGRGAGWGVVRGRGSRP